GVRQISARDGLEWARSRGYGFMETSARDMVNIEETFANLVKRVRDMRRDYAQGIKPALPTATSRTLPLEPLPATNEKAIPPGPGTYSQSRPPDRPGKTSFWSSLKCW
ncbi:hypothetical protein LTR53_016899, partial [Teratosphaeriaceae sp. CCFEE 6253]